MFFCISSSPMSTDCSLLLQVGAHNVLLRTLVAFIILANCVLLQTSVCVASTQTAQSSLFQFCNVALFYDCISCR